LGFALLNVGDQAGAKSALAGYLELQPEGNDAESVRRILKSLE
jgi:hypothetical protein